MIRYGTQSIAIIMVLFAPPFRDFVTDVHAGDAGNRDFPATLVVDEPQVESEITSQVATRGNGDNARQTDFGTELSVKLSPSFSAILHPIFTSLNPGGNGFQNLATELKYQFVGDAHETVISAGLQTSWGGLGSQRVGAEAYTTLSPTIYLGKGAGNLPESLSWAKPFALTMQASLDVPAEERSRAVDKNANGGAIYGSLHSNPTTVSLAGSLQYSFVYAANYVPGVSVPKALAELVPLIEYSFEIPTANNGANLPVIGTINPGFLWCHDEIQIGLEALIPINAASGRHPGFRLQLAYSFDAP